jgi:hypothetical protein
MRPSLAPAMAAASGASSSEVQVERSRRPRGTRCCNRLSRSSGDREAQVLAFPMVFRGVFARTSGVQASARILTYFGPLGFLMCWPMGWVGPNCRCDLFLFFHFGFKLASDSAGKLLDGSMVWNGEGTEAMHNSQEIQCKRADLKLFSMLRKKTIKSHRYFVK